jgi:nitrate reductase molybdenum cofactor assembly chaperone NarJ/NarW
LLLDYPEGGEADVALVAAGVDELPPGEVRERLARFLQWWAGLRPRDREVAYVETFELGPAASLYLTSTRSRDKHHRGRELLRLRDAYQQTGWVAPHGELPDYLPLMLEFAAIAPRGVEMIRDEREGLLKLRTALESSASPFAEVVAAVLVAAGDQAEYRGAR